MTDNYLEASKHYDIVVNEEEGSNVYQVIHRDHHTVAMQGKAHHEALEVMMHVEQLYADASKKWLLATELHKKQAVVQLVN